MVQNLVAMLGSATLSVQRSALKALALFLEDGGILHSHIKCMIRSADRSTLRIVFNNGDRPENFRGAEASRKEQASLYFV
jgi:hypothetical protein